MIRKIVSSTDPKLRSVSKPVGEVDKKIKDIIQDLKDTLEVQTDPEGVGLAAPQIGKYIRMFYAKYKNFERLVINPEIVKVSKNPARNASHSDAGGEILEGCLSLPHYYGPLKRAESVTLKYINEPGEDVLETFTGFHAQIVLHEIDHLNGILFVDKLLEQHKKLYKLDENDDWEEFELV